jgi:hypothetical protein
MEVPTELAPYFEVCFILGFGICDRCGREQPFESTHPKFSDERWLDEARAMRDAGWVLQEPLVATCPECAQKPRGPN